MRLISMIAALVVVALFAVASGTAAANNATYTFETEAQERQFRQLINELRCPKCQNQSIADSDAPLAQDLRDRVYQMTVDGASRQEILEFMRLRYGDFVHYKPPMRASTLVLWWGPGLIMLLGVGTVVWLVRAQKKQRPELTDEERQRLADLLDKEEERRD